MTLFGCRDLPGTAASPPHGQDECAAHAAEMGLCSTGCADAAQAGPYYYLLLTVK